MRNGSRSLGEFRGAGRYRRARFGLDAVLPDVPYGAGLMPTAGGLLSAVRRKVHGLGRWRLAGRAV
jgi:hypothetical protein